MSSSCACACGGKFTTFSFKKHQKTIKHQKYITILNAIEWCDGEAYGFKVPAEELTNNDGDYRFEPVEIVPEKKEEITKTQKDKDMEECLKLFFKKNGDQIGQAESWEIVDNKLNVVLLCHENQTDEERNKPHLLAIDTVDGKAVKIYGKPYAFQSWQCLTNNHWGEMDGTGAACGRDYKILQGLEMGTIGYKTKEDVKGYTKYPVIKRGKVQEFCYQIKGNVVLDEYAQKNEKPLYFVKPTDYHKISLTQEQIEFANINKVQVFTMLKGRDRAHSRVMYLDTHTPLSSAPGCFVDFD